MPDTSHLPHTDPLELLELATSIALDAGVVAAQMRADGISVASTKSSQLDIVTQADTAVEQLIRDRLHAARPDDGFFGEEGGQTPGTTGITWIVDPIDGTVNYLYGSFYYAVSIAAMAVSEDGRRTAIAGVVHAPALGTTYTAALGQPARRNGTAIRANTGVPLNRALVSTGIPYNLTIRQEVLGDINALTPYVRDFRLVGAAALEICGVAEGRTDAHIQRALPIWDYAAANLIAAQAGATVCGVDDRATSTELLIIADRDLGDAIDGHIG